MATSPQFNLSRCRGRHGLRQSASRLQTVRQISVLDEYGLLNDKLENPTLICKKILVG